MINAVIFDMDGVITDSEPLHHEAELGLLEAHHVHINKESLLQYTGTGTRSMLNAMIQKYDIEASVDQLFDELIQRLCVLFETKVTPIPHVIDLIVFLRNKGVPIAVASSSAKTIISRALRRLEIDSYFNTIVSGEDVTHSKPAPDIFLETARRLDVSPKNCVVIEDSTNGVLAAKSAGMTCIGFHSPNSFGQNLDAADMHTDSLIDLFPYFSKLFDRSPV